MAKQTDRNSNCSTAHLLRCIYIGVTWHHNYNHHSVQIYGVATYGKVVQERNPFLFDVGLPWDYGTVLG